MKNTKDTNIIQTLKIKITNTMKIPVKLIINQ